MIFQPGFVIIKDNQIVKSLYFINKYSVKIKNETEKLNIKILSKGSYFGDY